MSQEVAWQPLDPSKLESSFGAKFEKQEDLSVFVTGNKGKGTYTFTAPTELEGITGIRLEALSDQRLPSKGPGRAQNGNFVLSELALQVADAAKPDKLKPVKLQNAQADFSQQNYDVATAIDGKAPAQSNGWAISNELGKDHVAVFELAEPLTGAGSRQLTFTLNFQYQDGQHSLGKFRISVTTAKPPLLLNGPPKEIVAILEVPPGERKPPQKKQLLDYFRTVDPDLKQHQAALNKAQAPLPIDPELRKRQAKLAEVSQPLPVDPKLARLRLDVKLSEQQLANPRLTGAQDLVWALVNNPAFLFNH